MKCWASEDGSLKLQVGKWTMKGHETDEGALQVWIRHVDEDDEIYIGEWPKEEQA